MSELDQSKLLEAFQLATGVLLASLRVLNIEKLLLRGCRSAVPRTGAVASLDAGEELGLVPIDVLLCDPVHPEALVRRGDVAWDHGAARDLAFTAHLVPVIQALLLGGAQGVPGHNEVTESDVHLAVPLGLSCDEVLLLPSNVQRDPAHGRGGSRVDELDVLVRSFEHLYLLDLILNPLDGVAVDVVPRVHLLLTDRFGPDHYICIAKRLLRVHRGAAAGVGRTEQRPQQQEAERQLQAAGRGAHGSEGRGPGTRARGAPLSAGGGRAGLRSAPRARPPHPARTRRTNFLRSLSPGRRGAGGGRGSGLRGGEESG